MTSYQKTNKKIFDKGEQLAAVARLGQLALSGSAPMDVMAHAVSLATQILPVEYALMWELLDDGKSMLLMAGSRLGEVPMFRGQVPLQIGSLEQFTILSQKPVIMENIRDEVRFKLNNRILNLGVVSGVSIPIRTSEKTFGILEAFSREAQNFSQSDLAFLQSIANTIGLIQYQGRREEDMVTENQILRKEPVRTQFMTPSGHYEWDRYEIQNRLIESRERERLRLAQDLHNAPIQDLYGLIYQLDDVKESLQDPESKKLLDEFDHTLHKIVDSLRTICRELRPPSLSPFGLEVAIRDHSEKFSDQNPGIKVHLDLMQDKQVLSDSLRFSLFRIYQQAMHNVARHAEASEVHVSFHWDDEVITLEVKDNGLGFEVPQRWVELVREGHFGLLSIAERVESIRGKLEVISSPGNGTLVRTIVPRS